jgi:hypothetical protein
MANPYFTTRRSESINLTIRRPAACAILETNSRSWWPAPNRPSGDHGRLFFSFTIFDLYDDGRGGTARMTFEVN